MLIWEEDSGSALKNEEVLRAVEERLGHPFPDSFIAVIKLKNGAYFSKQDFSVETPDGIEEKSVATLLNLEGSSDEAESMLGMWTTLQEEYGIDHAIVPFAMDGGGNLTCLDFSSGSEPSVVYWQHDAEWPPLQIARNFSSFLDLLV
jgi:hypothetical protein